MLMRLSIKIFNGLTLVGYTNPRVRGTPLYSKHCNRNTERISGETARARPVSFRLL